MLVSLIGARLTGSRAAGSVAALICAANTNAVMAVAWASAYNQVLCGVLVLAAFYLRLRWTELEALGRGYSRWRAAEWTFYLLGFGALELATAYPALAALHAALADKRRLRGTLLLAVPAVAFVAVHYYLIPKVPSPIYEPHFDRRLASALAGYLTWTIEPGSAAVRSRSALYRGPAAVAGILAGLSLVGFAIHVAIVQTLYGTA